MFKAAMENIFHRHPASTIGWGVVLVKTHSLCCPSKALSNFRPNPSQVVLGLRGSTCFYQGSVWAVLSLSGLMLEKLTYSKNAIGLVA